MVGGICRFEGGVSVTDCLVKVCRARSAGQAVVHADTVGGATNEPVGGGATNISQIWSFSYFDFDTHLSLLVAFNFLRVEFAIFLSL